MDVCQPVLALVVFSSFICPAGICATKRRCTIIFLDFRMTKPPIILSFLFHWAPSLWNFPHIQLNISAPIFHLWYFENIKQKSQPNYYKWEKEYTVELGKVYLTKGMAIPEISRTNRLCKIYHKSWVLSPAWEATMGNMWRLAYIYRTLGLHNTVVRPIQ